MKLSENQQKAIESLREHGHIDVQFWGSSVFSMTVRGNIGTLKALVRKGIVKRTSIGVNAYRYTLID